MPISPAIADPKVIVDAVDDAYGAGARLHGVLDVDVYRLRHGLPGPDWVVRVFDDTVAGAAVETVAAVLARLDGAGFPAERCPVEEPVLSISPGGRERRLLTTEYVEARPAPKRGFLLAWCAGLLGRLATKTGETLPAGGGWHRLGQTPGAEIDAALRLCGDVGGPANELGELLASADDGEGLPEALIHPDLTPPNLVPQGGDAPVVVDWIGVGRGPRIWPLAFLLVAAGPRAVHVVLDRYCRSVTLTDDEWDRLPEVMLARPLALDIWAMAQDRMSVSQAVARARRHRDHVQATVDAARAHR